MYASAHRDIQPMILVHTCYSSNPGEERTRHWRGIVNGEFVRKTYKLQQPQVHQVYRESFSRVDVFNKLALGPGSVQDSYQTRSWTFKFFLCCVSMAETNAFLAYKWRHRG